MNIHYKIHFILNVTQVLFIKIIQLHSEIHYFLGKIRISQKYDYK